MRKVLPLLGFLLALPFLTSAETPEERFPPPDFTVEYLYPSSQMVAPRADWMAWGDTAFLLLALSLTAVAVLRWRNRRAIRWISIACLAYLGFYRKGCVCPIGAIQNVSQALFNPDFVLPWVVIVFFSLPLLFAILFGRVFCAGVCPLGAMQDLFLLRAVKVPRWLDQTLGVLRYFYLGLAVLLAAMGATYIICKYDPFVGFFRMSARFGILVWSISMLALSLFVGRPYCRYLCPYGALLGLFSRFSFRHASITPDDCVVCGLCHKSCPFGAIKPGAGETEDEEALETA